VWPLLERVVAGDGKGAIAEAERIAGRSVSFDAALEELSALLHRVALEQAGAGPSEGDADAARVKEIAARIDPGRVQVIYQVAVLGRRDLPLAPDEFAGFTMTLLRMISFMQPAGAPRRARETADLPAPPAASQASSRASAPVEAPARTTPAAAPSAMPA